MTRTTMTRKRFQAPTTRTHMPTCPFRKKSRKYLSTSSGTSPRRLILRPRLSPSSQTTSLQSVRSMPSSRCQSPTDRRKIWVLQFSTNPASTPKTRQSLSSSTFRAKMWRVQPPSTSTQLIALTRSRVKSLAGSAAYRISTRQDHPLLLIIQRTCPTSNH